MCRAIPLPLGLTYDEGDISSHCLKGHCTKGQALQYLARIENMRDAGVHFDTLGSIEGLSTVPGIIHMGYLIAD